jgi:Pectinacetylesterase
MSAFVLTLAVTAGACGGTTPGPNASNESATALPATDLSAFSECMRAHGIADFPDPSADGQIQLPADIDRDGAEFKAASAACEGQLPSGGQAQTSSEGSGPTPQTVTDGWEKVTPGGRCLCADGSEFSFQVRAASTDKVLLYFQAGGACFTAELCQPDSGLYHPSVGQAPPEANGIFDFAHPDNPFKDYTVVYVPYCTGDTFLGDATVNYTSDLTIHHDGFADGSTALDYLATNYPNATKVVVAGESAGSVAAPLYGGLAAERYPDATVTVIADSSGFYPDLPKLNTQLAQAWNVATAITALTAGTADASDFSLPGLYILSGQHHPNVVFARHDYAADAQQARWKDLAGIPLVDPSTNEAAIEAAGVTVDSYTAPGDQHVALSDGRFYTEEVDGTRLADWVADLITGQPVTDVASR